MAAVATTLVHDCVISEATGTAALAAVDVTTLVLDASAARTISPGWQQR